MSVPDKNLDFSYQFSYFEHRMRRVFEMEIDFYKEVERVEAVNQRLQWLISIWLVLFGGLLFCFNNTDKANGFEFPYNLSLIMSSVFLVSALTILCIGLWGTKSKRLPKPSLLADYYVVVKEHYSKFEGYESEVDKEFQK